MVALAFVFIGFGWWLISNQREAVLQVAIEGEKKHIAEYLRGKAAGVLSPEIFQSGDAQEQDRVFSNYWALIQSPEYVRIKIWDTNFTLIWADMKELIGQRFPDNHEMADALEGDIELEIDNFGGLENEKERQLFKTSEVYVPLYGPQGKEIVGVVEIYKTAHFIEQADQAIFRRSILVGIALLSAYALLGVFLHRFFKRGGSSAVL